MELRTSTNTFGGDASTRKCRQKVGLFSDQFQSWVYFDPEREGNRIYVYNFEQWLSE